MIIDIHTHITFGRYPEFSSILKRQRFTTKILLERMDKEGIDKSVLLPITNPENVDYLAIAGNLECVEAARKHPDRLLTFCCIDPRNMLNTPTADLSGLLRVYKDLGCVGIGELCANIPITDPCFMNLFQHAGREKMPVLMHFASRSGGLYGVIDDLHLPGLERVLKECPNTIVIGHAMSFWGEISASLTPEEREGYPKGPIKKEGRLWKLLEKYPNLYGDLSAGSGFNAISRDPEVGYRFLQRFNKKLFFGTDRFTSRTEPVPAVLPFLKEALKKGKISKPAYENIMSRNFVRVFGVGK